MIFPWARRERTSSIAIFNTGQLSKQEESEDSGFNNINDSSGGCCSSDPGGQESLTPPPQIKIDPPQPRSTTPKITIISSQNDETFNTELDGPESNTAENSARTTAICTPPSPQPAAQECSLTYKGSLPVGLQRPDPLKFFRPKLTKQSNSLKSQFSVEIGKRERIAEIKRFTTDDFVSSTL